MENGKLIRLAAAVAAASMLVFGGVTAANAAPLHDILITKKLDKSSPMLDTTPRTDLPQPPQQKSGCGRPGCI
jgi:hypothetical protein